MNLLKGLPIWKEEKIGEVAVVQSLALSTVSAQYVPVAHEFTPCCALLGPSGLCAAPPQVGMMLQTGESAPGLSRSTGAALCVLGQDRGQGSLWGCSLFCAHRWVEELWLLLSIYSATGVCRALWGFCHHHPRGERWEKFLFLSAAKGRDVPLWGWHEETELCSLPPSLVVGLIPCALRICSVYCVNQMVFTWRGKVWDVSHPVTFTLTIKYSWFMCCHKEPAGRKRKWWDFHLSPKYFCLHLCRFGL